MTCQARLFVLLILMAQSGWAQATQTPLQARADAWRQRAENLYAQANYQEATTWYEKAYNLIRNTDPVRAANLCVDLSSMDYMAGHNRVAADRCLRGLRHLRQATAPPDSALFKLYSSLGLFYTTLYRSDSALFCFRKADNLLIQHPLITRQIPLYVLHHYNNQGSWFFKTGNYTRSLSCLAKARELAGQFGTTEDVSYVESNIAGCYDGMIAYEEARKHVIIANTLYKKIDKHKYHYLVTIGLLSQKTLCFQEALYYYQKSEQLLTVVGRKSGTIDYASEQISLWWMTGTCHQAVNQLKKAEDYLRRALKLHQQQIGRQGPLMANILVAIGQLNEARHEPKQALLLYQAAIRAVCRDTTGLANAFRNPVNESATDESALLTATLRKAALLNRLHTATHNERYRNAAVETYRFAIGLQQRIRHGIDAEQSQLTFTEKHHTLVPAALSVAFGAYAHQPTAARRETLFQFFEQARQVSLNEALRLNTIKPQTIPAHLLDREQRLKKQINQLRRQPVADTAATTELTNCQLQWHQLIETFRQDFPAYYRLNYLDTPMPSQALQQQLDNKTAYISYVRHGASLFMLVATASAIDIIRQPIDSARFDRQLQALRNQLYTDPLLARYEGIGPSASLYATCIAPLLPYLTGKTRLVIARDWSFNFLPFEVLENGRLAQDYLTKHYAIAYAFSAQSFFDRPARPIATRPVLVAAPFARISAMAQATVNRQASIRPLVSSEAEARSIGGELLLGANATLSRFLKTDLRRNVIYLSTHAQNDDADPANSCILFYPGENDKLYTNDIYDLPLSKTGLVVLGACETGSGKTTKGEGILSLARAFAYAGCPSVVTTLWKANDETTSFLTIQLHHYLAEGLPIDQALQRARLDFFASPLFPKFNHPYYWANYTLLGSHHPVMPGTHTLTMVWWLAVAGMLGMVAFWQRSRITHWFSQKQIRQGLQKIYAKPG